MPVVTESAGRGRARNEASSGEGPGRDQSRRIARRELPPWLFDLAIRLETTSIGPWTRHVPLRSVARFYRLFAIMLNARLSYLGILSLMEELTRNRNLKGILHACYVHTANGGMLSDAMRAYPWVFDAAQVEMVRTAEREGHLDWMLVRIAEVVDAEADVQRNAAPLWLYPRIVLAMAMFALGRTFFVQAVPATSKLIGLHGYALLDYGYDTVLFMAVVCCAAAVLTAAARVALVRRPGLADWWEELRYRIPILGKIAQDFALARFLRNMSALLAAGTSGACAVEAAGRATSSLRLARAGTAAGYWISQGEPLWLALQRTGIFPEAIVQVAYTGHRSAEIDRLLAGMAERLEADVEVRSEIACHAYAICTAVGVIGYIGLVSMFLH